MHYVVIWQNDSEVETILKPLLDLGAGLIAVGGDHVRLFRMLSEGSPKGEWYDRLPIWSAIMDTARHALTHGGRLAEMRVEFIFHQTSQAAVRSIMGALQLLTPDALDGLAQSFGKDLHVRDVVLFSCESATDKTAPVPTPAALLPWVNQARAMRQACFKAFSIRRVNGGGEFQPDVITFSTGNAVTGGIVLDPWNASFVSLRGHFNANGGWDYELDANGQPDKTATPTNGTVYYDRPDGSSATKALGLGEKLPPMLPAVPSPP